MAQYNKGLLTDLAILNSAKSLFYEKGYSDSSIKEVCEHAGVHIGTFTYYYKRKEDLLKRIYSDYLMNHYVFVDANAEKSINSVQKNCYAILPFYVGYFDDPKTTKFHNEALSSFSIYDYLYMNLRRIYASFIKDLNIDMSNEELKYVSSADLGVRRELTLEFVNGEFNGDVIHLYKTIYTMMGRLFKMPDELMSSYINEAINFYYAHDYSHIKLLV